MQSIALKFNVQKIGVELFLFTSFSVSMHD